MVQLANALNHFLLNLVPLCKPYMKKLFSIICSITLIGIGSIKAQNFQEIHVITSDNSTQKPFLIEKTAKDTNQLPYKLLQLDNDGLLRTREIKVDLNSWPDYVFNKNYYLMPLKEVEIFINNNGHLPNVSPAKIIEEEGLNLGETNKLLMQKIEELTLYLIEQQKLLEQQQKRIEALELKVNLKP